MRVQHWNIEVLDPLALRRHCTMLNGYSSKTMMMLRVSWLLPCLSWGWESRGRRFLSVVSDSSWKHKAIRPSISGLQVMAQPGAKKLFNQLGMMKSVTHVRLITIESNTTDLLLFFDEHLDPHICDVLGWVLPVARGRGPIWKCPCHWGDPEWREAEEVEFLSRSL